MKQDEKKNRSLAKEKADGTLSSEIGKLFVVVNVIAAAVAELVEHIREAQHSTPFIGVPRYFLIPERYQIALT